MTTHETPHRRFADRIVAAIQPDPRFVGLLAAGSFAQGNLDNYSDLDLVLIVEDEHYPRILETRREFAASLGHLLYSFTGEHVGEPRLLICLYDDPILHVDLKFVTLDDLDHRIEEPIVLWHRDRRIPDRLPRIVPRFPSRDPAWFEERFWVWVHYTAAKLGRGELLETLDTLAFIRLMVLGPMAARNIGREQRGVRRLEILSPGAFQSPRRHRSRLFRPRMRRRPASHDRLISRPPRSLTPTQPKSRRRELSDRIHRQRHRSNNPLRTFNLPPTESKIPSSVFRALEWTEGAGQCPAAPRAAVRIFS